MSPSQHILIIEARFYDEIADDLLKGAKAVLTAAHFKFHIITVPGILELPAATLFAMSSDRTAGQRYAGVVALGCAVKGETDHYEYVCAETMSGLQRVAHDLKAAIGNGVLTCPTWKLAQNRANPGEGDAGGRAARACLRLIEIKSGFGL
jgi:6,7-dimethyl-8-ribityllumazine synthase